MHRPFVTTVKFENEVGEVVRVEYAVAAVDTRSAKTELERRFVDLEIVGYTIERIIEATTLQAQMLKLPPRCVMLLASTRDRNCQGFRLPVTGLLRAIKKSLQMTWATSC
jgi:hypothetical protein